MRGGGGNPQSEVKTDCTVVESHLPVSVGTIPGNLEARGECIGSKYRERFVQFVFHRASCFPNTRPEDFTSSTSMEHGTDWTRVLHQVHKNNLCCC